MQSKVVFKTTRQRACLLTRRDGAAGIGRLRVETLWVKVLDGLIPER